MDSCTTTAIFLITGLVTATGVNRREPTLELAEAQIKEEQYIAAIFTAEQIISYYPETAYSESAKELIELINKQYL